MYKRIISPSLLSTLLFAVFFLSCHTAPAQSAMQPGGNVLITDRQPEFVWQEVEGASWYHLWINRDGEKYNSAWVQGQTNWQPTGLMKGGSYKWWVGAYTNGNYLGWQGPSAFSVSNRAPAAVDLYTPAGTVVTNEFTFSWSEDSAAEWYQVWIQKNGVDYTNEWVRAETNLNFGTKFPLGRYEWWVRAWSPDGGAWSQSETFDYGEIEQLSPTGGLTLVEHRPTFEWTLGEDVDWYRLYIEKDGALYQNHWIDHGDSFSVTNDLPYGHYEWWVQTWNPQGLGPWTAGAKFDRGLPEPVEPVGQQQGSPDRMAWDDSYTTDATSYQILIDMHGGGYAADWLDRDGLTAEGDELGFQPFELPSGTYSWYVRASSPDYGIGPWTEATEFVVP